jgi:hypothetical protein
MLDHPSVAVAGDVDHGDFERAAGGWFAELAAGVGAGAAEPGPEGVAGEAGVLDAEVEVVGVGAQLADDGGDAGWPDDACWPGGCLELVFHEVGRDEPVEDSEVAVVASIGQITPVAFELQYSRQIADSQKAA